MSNQCGPGCLCNCCSGVQASTPRSVANAPGRSQLNYRVGQYGDFLQSMISELGTMRISLPDMLSSQALLGGALPGQVTPLASLPENPLVALTSRSQSDPTIAMLDAWSIVLHVMSFYSERIANEGYLRTATEFRSVLELARLVGYQPRPGVSATTHLAYLLEKDHALTIRAGSKAQSVPESGQLPQTFETTEDLQADQRWNNLVPRRARPQEIEIGQTTGGRRVWFQGLNLQLKPNEPVLLVFDAARGEPFRIQRIDQENADNRTRIVLRDFAGSVLFDDAEAILQHAQKMLSSAREYWEQSDEYTLVTLGVKDAIEQLLVDATDAISGVTLSEIASTRSIQIAISGIGKAALEFAAEADAIKQKLIELKTRLQSIVDFLVLQFVVSQPIDAILATVIFKDDATVVIADHEKLKKKWSKDSLKSLSEITLANLFEESIQFLSANVDAAKDLSSIQKCIRQLSLFQGLLVRNTLRSLVSKLCDVSQAGVDADTIHSREVLTVLNSIIDRIIVPIDLSALSVHLQAGLAALESEMKRLANETSFTPIAQLLSNIRRTRNEIKDSNVSDKKGELKKFLDDFDTSRESLVALRDVLNEISANQNSATSVLNALRNRLIDAANKIGIETVASLVAIQGAQPLLISGDPNDTQAVRHKTFADGWRAISFDIDEVLRLIDDLTNGPPLTELSQIVSDGTVTLALPVIQKCDAVLGLCDPVLGLPKSVLIDACPRFLPQSDSSQVLCNASAQWDALLAIHASFNEAITALSSPTKSLEELIPLLEAPSNALAAIGKQQEIEARILKAISELGLIEQGSQRFVFDTAKVQSFSDQLGKIVTEIPAHQGRLIDGVRRLILAATISSAGQEQRLPALTVLLMLWKKAKPTKLFLLEATQAIFGNALSELTAQNALGVLTALLPYLRQVDRLVRSGSYPRIQPWMDLVVGSLEQFASDLLIAPAVLTSVDLEKLHLKMQSELESSQLESLRTSQSRSKTELVTVAQRLDGGRPDIAPGKVSAKLVADLALQIVGEFNPQLSGMVYDAVENTKPVRSRRFQAIHALRVKAKPFGSLAGRKQKVESGVLKDDGEWLISEPLAPVNPADLPKHDTNVLLLDSQYDKITPGTFVVIEWESPSKPQAGIDNPLVARVEEVATVSAQGYGLGTTTVTKLVLDRPWLSDLAQSLMVIRNVVIHAQSEPIELAGEPYDADVGFSSNENFENARVIELDSVVAGLRSGQWIVIAGERTDVPGTTGILGSELALIAGVDQVRDAPNTPGQGKSHSLLYLSQPLTHSYQRSTVSIYANVVKADHGETKAEVIGSGDARVPGQTFELKHKPLTHLSSPTASGAESTLKVRVNGVLWHPAERGAELGPNDRQYESQIDADDNVAVRFSGARLPTGTDNVRAEFRVGTGTAGNLPAGKITQLLSRPLGVKEVLNPVASIGGTDRESTDHARRNAPLGVTALDRLVSVSDYADFARAYAGVEKSFATRITDGKVQRVHVTVAGQNGEELPSNSDLFQNLLLAMRKSGDPLLPLTLANRQLQLIVLVARITVHADFEFEAVQAAARKRVLQRFGFEQREFGQDVILSELVATIQDTQGIVGVVVDGFGTIKERDANGSLNSLEMIVDQLKVIADATQPIAQRIPISRTRRIGDSIHAAEIAFFSQRLRQTLILNEDPS